VIQPILVIQVRRQAFGALPFKDIHWSCQISIQQQELKQLRVSVECWFGRQQMLWGIIHGMYRWSKDHFDLNFDITALLTNEHIGISALAGTNQSFHLLYLQQQSIELQKH